MRVVDEDGVVGNWPGRSVESPPRVPPINAIIRFFARVSLVCATQGDYKPFGC